MPNIVLWIFTFIFAVLGILNGRHFSSIFFFIAAIICMPLPFIKKALSFLSDTQIISILLSIVIVFCGIGFYPALTENKVLDADSQSSQIIINEVATYSNTSSTTSESNLYASSTSTSKSTSLSTSKAQISKVPLEIEIVSLSSPISRGNTATLEIKGAPNTSYSIAVYYSNNKSTAKGLEEKTSDNEGLASWSWKVGARTKEGTHKIIISSNGKEKEIEFTVN